MRLREFHADLFSTSDDRSLAHCVAADFAMGAGIALEFRRRFGMIEELKNQNCCIGEIAFIVVPHEPRRYIYYLVTKEKSSELPTFEDLKATLVSLKDLVIEHGISRLSIPRLGCGLDRLKWSDVKDYIIELFSDMDISIHVFHI